MMLSVLLTLVFALMAVYTFIFFSARLLGWLLLASYIVAVFIVWWPDTTTALAQMLGIGRGVDLVLILVSVVIVNVIMFVIRHMYFMHQQITRLARHIAIQEADAGQRKSSYTAE